MIRLGILGSTRGTNMLAIIKAIKEHALLASIELVVSNKADALILERATQAGLKAQFLKSQGLQRSVYDQQLSALFRMHQVDLIVLIGYMRILTAELVDEWENSIINVHPSLLPAFAGKMDLEVHQAVLDSEVKETGCTIHFVTQEVDAGPILLQKKCPVFPDDTADTLKTRVQQLEGGALVEAIQRVIYNSQQNNKETEPRP